MANRFEMNEALKFRLLGAENAEQAADILKEAGQAATPEEIAHLWDEIGSHRTEIELSLYELESVSGGADRDWLKDGCAATVEPCSWCKSDDACFNWDVVYAHQPVGICPYCGGYQYSRPSLAEYVCAKCGKTEKWNTGL